MKAKEIAVADFYYDANCDAYLVLGRRTAAAPRLKNHVVGWISRLAPDRIIEPRSFLDPGTARQYYHESMADEDRPVALPTEGDPQQNAVYEWEWKFVSAPDDPALSGPEEARKIMRRVARDYGIKCPKLVWLPPDGPRSEYDSDDHTISFVHRDVKSLLHEMAHAIHARRERENTGPAHGPAFVWIAIELYTRYAGASLPFLVQSAAAGGLLGQLDGPLPFALDKSNPNAGSSPGAGPVVAPASDTRHSRPPPRP